MSVRTFVSRRAWPCAGALLVAALLAGPTSQAMAGGDGDVFVNFVGGVFIDTDGVLRSTTTEESDVLRKAREKALEQVPGDMTAWTDMRLVSLKALQAAIADLHRQVLPLTDEIKYLAGLQRVQYVFVHPDQQDIVLAGPAEGWKVDDRGNVVGLTTGRPVLLLDDLLVALRTAAEAANGGLTVSIDPTQEGISRLQAFLDSQPSIDDARTVALMEESMGNQTVTFGGLPERSHFARVMLAADYRMKRLAMAFDPSPVRGLPSYLQTVSAARGGLQASAPRWWMSTNYDALLKSPDGLAWELRGQGVKTMTEEELIGDDGSRQRTGRANPAAQAWAKKMTAHFEELSQKEPIFGELRNLFDLAVVAAVIVKEDLAAKAQCDVSLLLSADELGIDEYEAPRQVPSMASVVNKRGGVMVSVSGGVEIGSWQVAEHTEESADLATLHPQSTPAIATTWWWNSFATR